MSSPARSKERDALLDTPDEMAVVGRKEGRKVCVCVRVCVVEEAIRAEHFQQEQISFKIINYSMESRLQDKEIYIKCCQDKIR